ncbi:MAG: type II secretion system F family protein [Microbacteriaceae bacterium]
MIAAELALGLMLAIGLLGVFSPWLWPPQPRRSGRLQSWVRTQLNRANLTSLGIGKLVWISVFAAAFTGVLVAALTGVLAAVVVAVMITFVAPMLWVLRTAERRRAQAEARWPDVIDHLIGSIRSGLSLPDAMCGLAEHGPTELQPEFSAFAREYRRSGAFQFALASLQERCADSVADRLVEILRLSREVGGTQLVAVLQSFNASLRDDASIRAELKARQSWITNAARLGVAAPWAVLVLLSLRPEARAAYNSAGGMLLIAAGALCCVMAYLIMASIARFKREPRWSR